MEKRSSGVDYKKIGQQLLDGKIEKAGEDVLFFIGLEFASKLIKEKGLSLKGEPSVTTVKYFEEVVLWRLITEYQKASVGGIKNALSKDLFGNMKKEIASKLFLDEGCELDDGILMGAFEKGLGDFLNGEEPDEEISSFIPQISNLASQIVPVNPKTEFKSDVFHLD